MATSLPVFYNMPYTDKNGNMTSDSFLYNDQMFQTLNAVITVNGVVVPILSAAPANAVIGAIWYNSSIGTGKLQFLNSAGVQTISSAP